MSSNLVSLVYSVKDLQNSKIPYMYKLNRYTQSEREGKTHAKDKISNTEGLHNTFYESDIYARYLEYQPKPRPIHIKCKTIHMLSEDGKQSLPEFLVGASYATVIEEKM